MPPQEQMSLEQFNREFRTPERQGGRGMTFQAMCDKAHEEYVVRGYGFMVRHERRWVYTSYGQFSKMPEMARAVVTYTERPSGRQAKRYLIMQQSEVDYSGVMLMRHYEFDCKEFTGTNINLREFTSHQVERLLLVQAGGGVAGFLVYSKDTGHVFFVWASQVKEAQGRVLFQKGRGKHPKSFNREWLIEHSIQIGIFRAGQPVYWLEVLKDLNINVPRVK